MKQETKLCIGIMVGMLLMSWLSFAAEEFWFGAGFTALTVVWAGLIPVSMRRDL